MAHLPIVAFVDEPGFMVGFEAEKAGTIRVGTEAALMAQNYPLPWATVLLRKVYGVATAVHFAPNGYVLAWPSAETGALPVESGVAIKFGKEIAKHPNPAKRRRELEDMFSKGLTPWA